MCGSQTIAPSDDAVYNGNVGESRMRARRFFDERIQQRNMWPHLAQELRSRTAHGVPLRSATIAEVLQTGNFDASTNEVENVKAALLLCGWLGHSGIPGTCDDVAALHAQSITIWTIFMSNDNQSDCVCSGDVEPVTFEAVQQQ